MMSTMTRSPRVVLVALAVTAALLPVVVRLADREVCLVAGTEDDVR